MIVTARCTNFYRVSYKTVEDALTREDVIERDEKLKSQVRRYFIEENRGSSSREVRFKNC